MGTPAIVNRCDVAPAFVTLERQQAGPRRQPFVERPLARRIAGRRRLAGQQHQKNFFAIDLSSVSSMT
jgi:hypothetical protein